jgi:hypothetical protein
LLDWILARLRAHNIDDRLLAGEPPDGSPETVARRARLLDPSYRSAVANALRGLVKAAERHHSNFFKAQIPIREPEVLEARGLILELADEVEHDPEVSPRGVIMADRLIRDGDSPVYWHWHADGSVEVAVKQARAALHLG